MNSQDYDHQQLKRLRELKGMTQQQVADYLKVDRQTIYRAEAGYSVSFSLIKNMCELYGIDIRPLLHPRRVETSAA